MRSPLDLGFTTVEVIEFGGTDLLSVRELVARGEIVVIRDEVPPSPFPYQTQPVVTDYREFRDLWDLIQASRRD